MLNNSNEYAFSAQRRYDLTQMVIEGEEAEIVLKYAKKFKENAKHELLDTVAETDDEELILKATINYRVVCNFVNMLKSIVANGDKKRNTLQNLK